jgi:hypothetical protein
VHSVGETSWCYFRCLVQASYREARHIGPPGDFEAKCEVTGKFAEAAALCARNRTRLKGLGLWKSSERAETTAEVLAPYVSTSGLDAEEVPELFLHSGWQPRYGGPLWSRIAEVMNQLKMAIDEGEVATAQALCVETRSLRHNSGPLVPSADKWATDRWLQEKWPHLCS